MDTFFEIYIFQVGHIFFLSSGYLINSIFSGTTYKVHVFKEAFILLTIRMPLTKKIFRVVTCCEEHDTKVTWQIKYISPSVESVWTPNWAKCWISVRSFQSWLFDKVTNVSSPDRLKIWSKKTGRPLVLLRMFSTQTLKSLPNSCWLYIKR